MKSDNPVLERALAYFEPPMSMCIKLDLKWPDASSLARVPVGPVSDRRWRPSVQRIARLTKAKAMPGTLNAPLLRRLGCTFGPGLPSTHLSRPLIAGSLAAVQFDYHGGAGWLLFQRSGDRWQLVEERIGALY